MSTTIQPIFRDLDPDDPNPEVTEIESLCVNCHANGMTRLLLTKIPFYKEVVIMSFACEKCGFANNEIQSGGAINPEGVKVTLKVESPNDLNRQLVKSDYTSVTIPELMFEVPAKSQKGEVTTVEGVINRSIAGLEQDQTLRRLQHPEVAEKIESFMKQLQDLKKLTSPFTLILEDISGESFIQNPRAPQKDPNCTTTHFKRTREQNHDLGIYEDETAILHPITENEFTLQDLEGEVLQFPTNCPNCNVPCETNMKMTKIPHFKEVVIMATTCEACGHRTNEVKSGGGIEATGVHIEVEINGKEDFSRDVLKSETCDLEIPELELEVGPRALGGRFTTVEGLLIAMKEQLDDPQYSHMFRDSQTQECKSRLEEFLKKIDAILDGNMKITMVLDDPAGNSYIQSFGDDDTGLTIRKYERSFEQNEDLGLNDMKTENYQ